MHPPAGTDNRESTLNFSAEPPGAQAAHADGRRRRNDPGAAVIALEPPTGPNRSIHLNKRAIIAAVGAAALVFPAAASAGSGHDRGQGKRTECGAATSNDKRPAKRTKKVTLVFKGTFTGGGAVSVSAGNAHARRGGFLGQSATFELAGARIVVADTNADQKVDLADVLDG